MNKIGEFLKQNSYALFANILSLLGFAMVTGYVVSGSGIIKFDSRVNKAMVLLQNPLLNKIMVFITNIAGEIGLSILGAIAVGILFYKRRRVNEMPSASLVISKPRSLYKGIYKKRWEMVLFMGFGLSGALVSKSLIKKIIHRARPENSLVDYSTFSFPSGHATMATIFFLLVLYIFKDEIKDKVSKYFFITLNIVLFLLIGFSRIYLNVHWFSDVIAGFFLGIFWFTFSILIFKYIKRSV